MNTLWYRLVTAILAITLALPVRGQIKPDYVHTMDSLLQLYQQHKLNDTSYMNMVKDAAAAGYGHPDFAKQLQPFYKIAFKDDKASMYKVSYYIMLTLDANLEQKTGRCLYYLEKEVEERKKLSKEYAGHLAMVLYQIGIYRNNTAYQKCTDTYNDITPQLERIAAQIRTDNIDKQSVADALGIIAAVMPVYAVKKDIGQVVHLLTLGTVIYNAAMQRKGIYVAFEKEYEYYYHNLCYGYHVSVDGFGSLAIQDLRHMQDALLAKNYPDGQPTKYALSELYFRFAQCYIQLHKADSAWFYIKQQTLLNLDNDGAAQPITRLDYLENTSEIQAMEHQYEAAYKKLSLAYNLKDTLLQQVMTDRDNNLYAEALAEDRQLALNEAKEQKAQSKAFTRMLVGGIVLMALLGSLLVSWLKWQQRKKYLDFKLNMARNLHDETGPALLYAKALAQKEAADNNNYSLLEAHIGHTMEVIRGLAHDLKSNEQHTIVSLGKEIEGMLKKLGSMAGFDYDVKPGSGSRRFISHFQYTQLKAILHECISNSVKHADSRKINIEFKIYNKRMHVAYNDDGRGPEPDKLQNGIGIENIGERARKLGGHFKLDNNYPNGYSIALDIPLL